MTCDPLAYTGSGVHVGILLIVAVALLFAGAVVLLMTRRRGRLVAAVLLVLISAATASVTAPKPVQAAATCPPAKNFLTVVQTSIMDGLAPGVTPARITGIVRNNGTDSTYITAVNVQITGVLRAPDAPYGRCDASDYRLVDPLMPVGRTVRPGSFTAFQGASIGLRNKSSNQDACKGATITLLYTANPH
jgi:hypothetical protein